MLVPVALRPRVPCCSSPGQTGIDAARLQGHTGRPGTTPEAGDPRDREPSEGERGGKKERGEFLDLAQQSGERRGHPVGQLSLGPARSCGSVRLPLPSFFSLSLQPTTGTLLHSPVQPASPSAHTPYRWRCCICQRIPLYSPRLPQIRHERAVGDLARRHRHRPPGRGVAQGM